MISDMVHIALAANHRYVRGLNATFVSMINATSDKEHLKFHVFDDGLTLEDRDNIVALGIRFGYHNQIDFRKAEIPFIQEKFIVYNSALTPYFRLFFPDMLNELDWVLWADVDTLWFRDPVRLWAARDERFSVFWSQDIPSTRKWGKRIAKWRPNRDESHYACSGVMLMNLKKMRSDNFISKCISFVEKWGTPLFADQDILNEICYEDSKFVDSRWDCLYPTMNLQDGVVLHFNGIGSHFMDAKFVSFSPLFEIWFRYYAQVVEGRANEIVASWWKRFLYNLIALFYPFHRAIAVITDHIHPWVSDFIQRLLFFSWVRRLKLWR